MPVYKIADLSIKIEPEYECTRLRLAPYLTDSSDVDFEIKISKEQIIERSRQSSNPCSKSEAESVLILTQLCTRVLECYNGFFFHSSSLMLDGEAYIFTAPSGTGKSTHTALWRKHFGSRVTMINDDKPIIRNIDGKFFVYGTPWMGKADIGNNIKAPIKAVYLIKRGNENKAVRVKAGEVFGEILTQTVIPSDREQLSELLSLLDSFFRQIPLYVLTCTVSDEAVEAAYNAANNK